MLRLFGDTLAKKRFSCPTDDKLVAGLMDEITERFGENWEIEAKKQASMAQRTRDMLLSWGKFSERYVKKARFGQRRSWGEMATWAGKVVVLWVVPPLLALPLYLVPLPGPDAEGLLPLVSMCVCLLPGKYI